MDPGGREPVSESSIAVIGGGPAGMFAAIWADRLRLDAVLLEKGRRLGGQLKFVHNPIHDLPGSSWDHGGQLAVSLQNQLEQTRVRVETSVELETIQLRDGILRAGTKLWRARFIMLATGASPRRLGIPGESEMIARGEAYSTSHPETDFRGRNVVVVGGGDRAFEGAFRLASGGAQVTLVHRSDIFRARGQFRRLLAGMPNVRILTGYEVTRIFGESSVEGVELLRLADGHTEQVSTKAVFVRIGVEPNSKLVAGQVDTNHEGYVLVDLSGQSSNPRLYAAGDVCTPSSHASLAASFGQAATAVKSILLECESGPGQM